MRRSWLARLALWRAALSTLAVRRLRGGNVVGEREDVIRAAARWESRLARLGHRAATDPRSDGDVLVAVGPAIRHRRTDDPRAQLPRPEDLPRACVDGAEPPFDRAVEDHVAACGERATVDEEVLGDLPALGARRGVVGDERARMTAGSRVPRHLRTPV